MKFYRVRQLFIVLVRCPVRTPVRTPMYGLPLSQSDQRILSVFQSVYDKDSFYTAHENEAETACDHITPTLKRPD